MKKKLNFDPAMANILRTGKGGAFWAAMTYVIQGNVDYLEGLLLDDKDESLDESLNVRTKRDLLRKWYALNKELLTLPESIIRSIEGKMIQSLPDFDPYRKVEDAILTKERK